MDQEIIRQRDQITINKDIIREIRNIFDHNYKVVDNLMLINHTEYKYKTPYKGPFLMKQCFTNGKVNIQCGLVQIEYNIGLINPYKYNT